MIENLMSIRKSRGGFILATAVAGTLAGFAPIQTLGAEYKAVQLNYIDLKVEGDVGAHPIQTRTLAAKASDGKKAPMVVELDSVIHPSLTGIGGAFNEQGGEAFMSLPEADRKAVAEALFNPETGAGLTLCRTAVGSSDFGLGAYSYSEVADDYQMKHFSVERDTKSVIPFMLAAKAENPQLSIFASPWSPPGWMKKNGRMDTTDAGPEKIKTPNDPDNTLKTDPKIYDAYALYFSKYVQGYAKYGVAIDRLIIQNETDMNPSYPGCDMLPAQMAELVSNHIRPRFTKDGVKTELWAGSFRGKRRDAQVFMSLDGAKDVAGVGLQYAPAQTKQELQASHPGLKMMHTEGKCWNGDNSSKQAHSRFPEMASWLNSGCENYCYWNMVLNETSSSAWGWKQNSLLKIDRKTGAVTYNADFAPVALLGRFIRPGDQLLKISGPGGGGSLAVRNAERVVVFRQNPGNAAMSVDIELAGQKTNVELPGKSLCAVVFELNK
jgi:glucosylceramidase